MPRKKSRLRNSLKKLAQPLREVLVWLNKEIKEINPESAWLEAELLVAFVLNKDRAFIYTIDFLTDEEIERLKKLLDLRKKRIPLNYIIEKKQFYDIELFVEKGVLIPRAETEILIEVTKDTILKEGYKKIVEIGVGSGNISITLAKEFEDIKIYACDISPEAIKVAGFNAKKHGVSDKIEFFFGPLLYPMVHRNVDFELIISNPPYIASWEFPFLQKEIKKEPWEALYGGWDGCEFYRKLFTILKKRGKDFTAILEISPYIYHKVLNILKNFFDSVIIEAFRDYLGHERVIKVIWH